MRARLMVTTGILLLAGMVGPAFADMTSYVDPTENAFSVAVPAGWQVQGGVQRQSPAEAHTWLALSTPDGSTVMFVGDPEVPAFLTPGPYATPNTWKATAVGVAYVAPYETGGQFAADYAARFAGESCADVKITGVQAEPQFAEIALQRAVEYAQSMGVTGQPPAFDGGTAYFTCDIAGKPYAGEVIAVTGRPPPLRTAGGADIGGGWWVPDQGLLGFRAPLADGAARDQLLRGLPASFQVNPQWQQGMRQQAEQLMAAIQENDQKALGALRALADSENQTLAAMGRSDTQTLTDEHRSFIAMMDGQAASEKAGFDNHMQQKAIGQFNEMLYINNEHCIRYAADDPKRCTVYAND